MTLDRLLQLRTAIYFTTKADVNNIDKFQKVRPLFDTIRRACLRLNAEGKCSIDEEMIGYRGNLNIKQYMKNNPNKWYTRIFNIFGPGGHIMYNFILQQTTEFNNEYMEFGQRAAIIMQLSERLKGSNAELYFANSFSTFHLFESLKF